MRKVDDVYINSYQRFIQKLQQIEINLHILQQKYEYEKKLLDTLNENKQNLESKINQITSLKTTLSPICEKITSSLFDDILNEINKKLPWVINSLERSQFYYKTYKSIDCLAQITEPSENLKILITLLDEINLLFNTTAEDYLKNAVHRIKYHLVLTAIEKQDVELKIKKVQQPMNDETSSFLQKKLQLGIALKKYCFEVAEQLDYCTRLTSLTKKFLNSPNDSLTSDTTTLLSKIYNHILDNTSSDEKVTGLIEEIIEEASNNPQKEHKQSFSDFEETSLSKSSKDSTPSLNSPSKISLVDLVDASTNLVPKQLSKVTFKPPKKRSLESDDYDDSDEEDNKLHRRPVKR